MQVSEVFSFSTSGIVSWARLPLKARELSLHYYVTHSLGINAKWK